MSALMKSLGIDQLDVAEQIELIDEIWDSIAENTALLPVSDELKTLLQRRSAAFDANPDDLHSLDEVMETVRRDLAD